MARLTDLLHEFWFGLFNRRAMDEIRALMHPDYEQIDHRALTASGADSDGWFEWTATWFDVVPDLAVRELKLLAEEGEHVVYLVIFTGHDAVTGGDVSGAIYVVNRMIGGRFRSTELFDDRGAALDRFAELAK